MSNDIEKHSSGTEHDEVKSLITDLCQIIEQARGRVARAANYELTMMYWRIGRHINSDVLDHERAVYGEKIVATVSRQLQSLYSYGYTPEN